MKRNWLTTNRASGVLMKQIFLASINSLKLKPVSAVIPPAALIAILASNFLILVDSPVLWRDEANNLAESRLPWDRFFHVNIYDTNGFTYAFLLRTWSVIFGTSELAIRGMSFLAIALTPFMVFCLCRQIGLSRAISFASGSLCVLTPFSWQFYLGQARPYALIYPIAAWTITSALRLDSNWNMKAFVKYSVSLTALINLLPSCLALGAGCSSLVIINTIRSGITAAAKVRNILLIFFITLCASAPALTQSFLFSKADSGYDAISSPSVIAEAVTKYCWDILRQLLPLIPMAAEYAFDDNLPFYALQWMAWPAAALVAYFLFKLLTPLSASHDDYLTTIISFIVLLLIMGFALIAGACFDIRMLTSIKTLPVVTIPIIILFSLITWRQPSWIILFAIMAACRSWTASISLHDTSNGEFSDARRSALFISENSKKDDLIVLANPQLAPTFSYYFKGLNEQIHHPYQGSQPHWEFQHQARLAQDASRTQSTLTRMRSALDENRRIWFIHSGIPVPDGRSWWYCPDALPLFIDFLNHNAKPIMFLDATSANEPFWVTLYTPPDSLHH